MQHTIGAIAIAIIAGLVFLILVAQSGALVWTIAGGAGTAAATFFVARDLRVAATFGGVVALGVSMVGIAKMLAG